MDILISGVGIAGPTLAYWLVQHGFEPTLVERAPRLRSGGYVIDFWGSGFDVAERMGLADGLKRSGYEVGEVRFVDSRGRRAGGFDASVFRQLTRDRFTTLPRSDLSRLLFQSLDGRVDVLFGDSVQGIEQANERVHVEFERARPRSFDLVIGADGLHSEVRRLVFGPQALFERPLGYAVAAFECLGYRPRNELVYLGYGTPGKLVARFAMRDDRTLFLFVFAHDFAAATPLELDEQKKTLHDEFDGAGWECDRILREMDACDEIYLDRVSQIRMDSWSKGRVALVGDAAACPSLLAGAGAALAMTAAYLLAGELHSAAGDHRRALLEYERRLRLFLAAKQRAAVRFASAFAPRSAPGLFFRNQVSRALNLPWIGKRLLAPGLFDDFVLPSYSVPALTRQPRCARAGGR